MIINLEKGFIKKMNDVNQDLKTIYSRYTVHHSCGLISGTKPDYQLKTGIHVCTLSINPLYDYLGETAYILDAQKIYKIIKDYKKSIDKIFVDGSISFNDIENLSTDIGSSRIGVIVDSSIKDYPTRHNDSYDMVNEFSGDSLSVSDVMALMKNKVVNVGYGQFRSRITKELLPGLKKTHAVAVMFTDVSDTMFDMTFRVTRDTITSYHRYRCVKLQ